MREIPLNQGKFALVDDGDYERLQKYHWSINTDDYTFYAKRNRTKSDGPDAILAMHRFILNIPKGSGLEVDHIDSNGLNNCRDNLRICTRIQNARNRKKRKGSSKFKGVHFVKKHKKWRSQIGFNGKMRYIGCFSDERLAADAYDKMAIKLHGEYASTNSMLTGAV